MMKFIEHLNQQTIGQTHGSDTWTTSCTSTSVTTHRHGKANDMSIWFICEVLTRTSKRDHYGSDLDIRKQKELSQVFRRQKDKEFPTSQLILHYKNTWNGKVCTGRSTLRNRKIQNANINHHHLQAGHQAQHGGVHHLGTKVGRNGTRMGGKTKGWEGQCRIHASNGLWKQLARARSLIVVHANPWVLVPCLVLQQLCFFIEIICTTSQFLKLLWLFYLVVVFFWQFSRPDSSNSQERDGWCRHHTCLYEACAQFSRARMTSDVSLTFGSRARRSCAILKRVSSLHHVLVRCSCWSFSSDCFFSCLFSVTTLSLVNTFGWNQKSSPASLLDGVECLAAWPIRLQTQNEKMEKPKKWHNVKM